MAACGKFCNPFLLLYYPGFRLLQVAIGFCQLVAGFAFIIHDFTLRMAPDRRSQERRFADGQLARLVLTKSCVT